MVTWSAELVVAVLAGATSQPAPQVVLPVCARTAHYELRGHIPPNRARELAALLEAGYAALGELLGRRPPHGHRCRVHVFPCAADRDRALGGRLQAGGIFVYADQHVYVALQHTRYFTRHLILHEATHQFVAAAFARRVDFLPAWLAEGLAEFVAHHNWDGRRLQIGLWDVVTLPDSDRLAQARQRLDARGLKIADILRSDSSDRVPAWALTYVLMTRHRQRLRRYVQVCLDRAGDDEPTAKQSVDWFTRVFGADCAPLQAELDRFVRDSRRRWHVLWPDWHQQGVSLVGHGGDLAAMLVDRSCADLSGRTASVVVTCDWPHTTPGLLVGVKSDVDFHVLEVCGGRLVHFGRRFRGHWSGVRARGLPVALRGRRTAELRVWHQDGHVHLAVEGSGTVRLPMAPGAFAGAWGLWVFRGQARFDRPTSAGPTTRSQPTTRPRGRD